MTCMTIAPRFVLVETDQRTPGTRIRERRLAIGMSVRELAAHSGINRETIAKAEADAAGRATTYAKLEATLNKLEEEVGMDSPDLVTSTITLPDGTQVVFAGTADGVAEAAAKYVRERQD